MLQTGPGSSGIAHQHITADAQAALLDAFSNLLTVLDVAPRDLPFNTEEIQQMAADGKAELASPKPNATKLKAYVHGIGNAIAYAPHLKDAYDTLKWAGSLFGVVLP